MLRCPLARNKEYFSGVILSAGFEARMVSEAEDIGIIQKRIIQNLYENPIILCDVSGKNPNVMFELGLRLAFDKPILIVKDDKTSYSFDTSPIEHLEYPRDLRYTTMKKFRARLKQKIIATYEKASKDQTYSPFLKSFGQFTVAKLETQEISKDEYILQELRELRLLVSRNFAREPFKSIMPTSDPSNLSDAELKDFLHPIVMQKIRELDLDSLPGVAALQNHIYRNISSSGLLYSSTPNRVKHIVFSMVEDIVRTYYPQFYLSDI